MNLILATGYYIIITIIMGAFIMEYIWYNVIEPDDRRKCQLTYILNDTKKGFILTCLTMIILSLILHFQTYGTFSNILFCK